MLINNIKECCTRECYFANVCWLMGSRAVGDFSGSTFLPNHVLDFLEGLQIAENKMST